MRGIYTAKRNNGTAVYIDYQPPGGPRVREKVELVANAPNMARRLSEARKRAQKELVRRQAAIAEGRYESMVGKRRTPTFAEYLKESYIPAMKLPAGPEAPEPPADFQDPDHQGRRSRD